MHVLKYNAKKPEMCTTRLNEKQKEKSSQLLKAPGSSRVLIAISCNNGLGFHLQIDVHLVVDTRDYLMIANAAIVVVRIDQTNDEELMKSHERGDDASLLGGDSILKCTVPLPRFLEGI